MKRMSITMSMWDSLAIVGQINLLKEALAADIPSQVVGEPHRAISTNQGDVTQDSSKRENHIQGKNVKSLPFYVSLTIGNNLVRNCMVDSGATSSIMPKKITD